MQMSFQKTQIGKFKKKKKIQGFPNKKFVMSKFWQIQ